VFFQAALCLKVEAFNGGGIFVKSSTMINEISQCGTIGTYVKLSEYDGYTSTDMTYVATTSPAGWSGIVHFYADAAITQSTLKIIQLNGTGSATPSTFEVQIKVPVTKGCESDSPSLVPSKQRSVPPSLLQSTFPSMLPSMIPSVPPSKRPSSRPSVAPTDTPSFLPSSVPSVVPTNMPSYNTGNLNNDMYFVEGFSCFKIEFRSSGLIAVQNGNISNCNSGGFVNDLSLSQYDSASGNKIYYTTAGSSYPFSGVFTIEFTAMVTNVKVTVTVQGASFDVRVQFPSGYTITSGADIVVSTA
jgi:hypothetical protein